MKRLSILIIFTIININCFSQIIDGLNNYDDELEIIVKQLKENKNQKVDIKTNGFYDHFEFKVLNDTTCQYKFIKPFNKEELNVSIKNTKYNSKHISDSQGFIVNYYKFYNGKDSITKCTKTKLDNQNRPIEIQWFDTITSIEKIKYKSNFVEYDYYNLNKTDTILYQIVTVEKAIKLDTITKIKILRKNNNGITTSDTTIIKKVHFYNRKKQLVKVIITESENSSKIFTKETMYIWYRKSKL